MCRDKRRQEWRDGVRAIHGCTRVDLPTVPWDVDVMRLTGYMGRPAYEVEDMSTWRVNGATVPISPDRPPEDPADGCPGGWVRSPFALSVLRYTRTRADGGIRNQNHLLDRADDRLIEEAVLYYEREQDRVFAHQAELIAARRENS